MRHIAPLQKTGGFTLMELALSLIIIGLLAGSIFVGRDLIHAAEVRGTVRQIEMFNASFTTFRLKYNCMPGDCSNASAFGFSSGSGIIEANNMFQPVTLKDYLNPMSDAYAIPVGGVGGVGGGGTAIVYGANGNGNDNIDASTNETFAALDQLQTSGLITGFDRNTGTVPVKISNAISPTNGNRAGIMVAYLSSQSAVSLVLPSMSGNYYIITGTSLPGKPGVTAMLPVDAFAIDNKIDDGLPGGGFMTATGGLNADTMVNPMNIAFNPVVDQGPAGPNSNYCRTLGPGSVYNAANTHQTVGNLCTLIIHAPF